MKVLQDNAQAQSDFAYDIGVRVSSYFETRFVVNDLPSFNGNVKVLRLSSLDGHMISFGSSTSSPCDLVCTLETTRRLLRTYAPQVLFFSSMSRLCAYQRTRLARYECRSGVRQA